MSATAALLFLLLSLLAVAHCRPINAQAAATDAEPAAAVEAEPAAAAGDDENGSPNPTLPDEAGEVALPAEQQQHGFLRLPSHRPCRHGPFHRHHLWWARHHGAGFGEDDAPRRLHFHHHGEALTPLGHLAALPLPAEAAPGEEAKAAVAEPDPVRAWKKEMQRRWWFHHHRHGMHLHRHRHDVEEEEAAAEGLKPFHHHHPHGEEDDDEEKSMMMRKRIRHDDGAESDDEEMEELVRRFRKAIMLMRRRFGHGRRFHHYHYYGHYRHAEKADDAQEEGGVVSWIKALIMNRF